MSKDKELWESYTRTLKSFQPKLRAAKKAPDKAVARAMAQYSPIPMPKDASDAKRDISGSLERRREKLLRQGEVAIEAKLDLHGMTQVEAFEALARFLRAKRRDGSRVLLIVTGKGRGGEGVLKTRVKNWLTQLPESRSILAVRPAAPQHGGDGAFYVIMRKGGSRD